MRILSKILKITGIIIISIIVIMILTVVVAKIFEDDLASFTIEKLEKEIDAPLSVGKVSLIPLFSFPRLSAEINKLYIGDPQSQYNDTLFFINSLKVGLDSWDLINGIYTIDEMEISGLDFDYEVDSTGKSNIDFIINAFVDTDSEVTSDTVRTPLDLSAEKLKLEDIKIRYYDSYNHIGSQVIIPEIIVRAKTKNNIYKGITNGSFILSNCLFKETKLDQMESCTIAFELEYKDKEAIINELSIISEGINLGVEGVFNSNDGLALVSNIEARNLNFEILKKYIPNQFSYLFEDANLPQTESVTLNLDVDYTDKKLDVKKLVLNSEGVDLNVVGTFNINDTISMAANIESVKLDLDILKKYIPKQYFNDYGIIDIGGGMDLSAKVDGQYADSTLLPMIVADMKFNNVMVQTVDYPKIDAVNLEAHISTGDKPDMSEANINIANFEVVSGINNFQIEGNIAGLENTQYSFRSSIDLNLSDFGRFVPDTIAKNIQGNIVASVRTSGMLPKKITNNFLDYALENTVISLNINDVGALFTDSLQIENFSTNIDYAPQGSGYKEIKIDKLNLKSSTLKLDLQNSSLSAIVSGDISEPVNLSAKLKSLKINNGKNQIIGNGEVKNFETPEFDVNANILLSLSELMPFIPDSVIDSMTGTIVANIHTKGKINPDSLDTQLFPILFENSNINLAFNSICMAFPDSVMDIDSLSARIGLRKDILSINDFSASYNGLDFYMDSTIVRNIYKAVLLNQPEELYVNTQIKIGDLLFDNFKHLLALETENISIDTISEDSQLDSSISEDQRNWTYLIHGSASVNSLIIDSTALDGFNINQLHINELSALFLLKDSSYVVDQFKFKVFEGEMINSLNYKVRDDGTQSISTHNIIKDMNIRTMLRDMDNFGMDSLITYNNISGLFSTDLNTFVPIDDSVLIDKMLVSGDITIEKGGVYNYAPVTEISKFSSIKELDNIQFKTLRSNIFMFKNKIYVPRTNIVSNALDIAAFGMQSLEGDSEYHMELHLSNILFGKSKRRNKKQNESGEEVDEGSLKKSSQKIRYAVTDGKSKVGRDTKEDREDMMNKIRVQNKMLDFIFFPKNIHYNTEPE